MNHNLQTRNIVLGIALLVLVILSLFVLINDFSSAEQSTQQLHAEKSIEVESEQKLAATTEQLTGLDETACHRRIDTINEKYAIAPSFFYQFKDRFSELVVKNPHFTKAMIHEASLQMAISTLSPIHQSTYRRSEARMKPITFNMKGALKNAVYVYQIGHFINAIEQSNLQQAHEWLSKIVAANPNTLILTGQTENSLLIYGIEFAIATYGFNELKILNLINFFTSAGYTIQFYDLVAMTDSSRYYNDFRESHLENEKILKMLMSIYEGSVNYVFNHDYWPSTNLVELALSNTNLIVAKFWQDNGVDAITNSAFQFINGAYPTYKQEDPHTLAAMQLIESGAVTYRFDIGDFERDALNQFLPNQNAQEYIERFSEHTFLLAEQQQLIEEIAIIFVKQIFLLQTKNEEKLPYECSWAYLKELNLVLGSVNSEAYTPTYMQSEYIEHEELIMRGIIKSRDISIEEKFEKLVMMEGRLAKEELDFMLTFMDVYGNKDESYTDGLGSMPLSDTPPIASTQYKQELNEEEEVLLRQANNASSKGDFELYESLLDQIQNLSRQDKLLFLLSAAINTNASPEKLASVLQKGAKPTLEMLETLIVDRNLQSLKTLLNQGFSVDYNAQQGFPLLKIAAKNEAEAGFTFLLESGANIELPIVGLDALDIALYNSFSDTSNYTFVEQLLIRGKNIEESHRQAFRDLLIRHPEKTIRLLNQYDVDL